jgi:hypothetical protein
MEIRGESPAANADKVFVAAEKCADDGVPGPPSVQQAMSIFAKTLTLWKRWESTGFWKS